MGEAVAATRRSENALTRLPSRRPPGHPPSRHVSARQRGFCPHHQLRHASEISVAGDDPVNGSDPSGQYWCNQPGGQTCSYYIANNYLGSKVHGLEIYHFFLAEGLSSPQAAGIAGALVEESNGSPSCVGVIADLSVTVNHHGYSLVGGQCNILSNTQELSAGVGGKYKAAYGIAQWESYLPWSSSGNFLSLLRYARAQGECSGTFVSSKGSQLYANQFSCWETVSSDLPVQLNFLWNEMYPGSGNSLTGTGAWHDVYENYLSDSLHVSDLKPSLAAFDDGPSFDQDVINQGGAIPAGSATSAAYLAEAIQELASGTKDPASC
ncbi:MAG TPA: phage tail tip lysozyme [Acidimicrobiales bacterium]|nr:phage tail tip lysozyme [Acidimicrobiales bacterium]